MTEAYTNTRPRQRRPASARALPSPLPDGLKRRLENAERLIAEPFRGISSGGARPVGLFPIRRTGVSTGPIKEAADAFLAALTQDQRASARFDIDSDAWRRWSNIHVFLMRHGVLLESLAPSQREAALMLMQSTLSAKGFETARNVMRLNETIGEITGSAEEYGEWLYWMSLIGAPDDQEPWGWQIDGHHLIVNAFILGDQLVTTPMFMGSEPVEAPLGKYAGVRVFQEEEAYGLALMQSLDQAQRRKALLSDDLPDDVFTSAFRDNFELRYEGIRVKDLTSSQQSALVRLIHTYVGRTRPGHAEVRMEEVRAHLDDTYFAWMGGWENDSVFYYRIHSPVILIEFDHQAGVALDNPAPTRTHIHTVVRTPNGNDYGKDLLRQHRESHAHG